MTQGTPELGQAEAEAIEKEQHYGAWSEWPGGQKHEFALRILEARGGVQFICEKVFKGLDVHPDNLREVEVEIYSVMAALGRAVSIIKESVRE